MKFKKITLLLLAFIFVALSAFCGCKKKTEETGVKTSFTFTVVHKDGSTKSFDITTTQKTVGRALVEKELISGDEGTYGIYVKTVDGETLDFNTDGYWWALYKNDQKLMTGADQTDIEQGETYTFKAEKS